MAKTPGQMVYDGRTVSFPGDGSAVPGDLVSIDANGQVAQTDGDNSIGVLSDKAPESHDAGDDVPVHVTGVVIANVADGTAAGDGLGEPDTANAGENAGELVAGSEYDAFSDEGGAFKHHDSTDATLDAGYAAVHLG